MPALPVEVVRVTKHKKPRYQLYQPGFNPSNSCWLEGDWITLPKGEWEKRKTKHQKLYKDVRSQAGNQHHRNKGTSLKKLSEAQRQAYEFFAGTATIECWVPEHNYLQPVGIDLAGPHISERSCEWLRKSGYKVLREIKDFKGKTVNQVRPLRVPEDLIIDQTENGEPIDPQAKIVEQNMARFEAQFFACLKMATDESEPEGSRGFAAMTMFGTLIMQEETLMRAEWREQQGEPDAYTDLPRERARYAKMRAELEKVEGWREHYDEAKANHNKCERHNLDNTRGRLFCFVLPEFHSDGTHEPWGPRDVPWAQK